MPRPSFFLTGGNSASGAPRAHFSFLPLSNKNRGNLGVSCLVCCAVVPCLGSFGFDFSRRLSRWPWEFPDSVVFLPRVGGRRQALRQQLCRRPSASRRRVSPPRGRKLLGHLAFWQFLPCSHNPEVVGSNPAPATIPSVLTVFEDAVKTLGYFFA